MLPQSLPLPPFEYRRLGHFTYHFLTDPTLIKEQLTRWILFEWDLDYNQAPDEHWTLAWMQKLPKMEFSLAILPLDDIRPHPDLWKLEEFQRSLQERANDREWSMLRGVSIEPLVVDQDGFQLMDGYTRYKVLKKYSQDKVYTYIGKV
jgi:hypothetical protein